MSASAGRLRWISVLLLTLSLGLVAQCRKSPIQPTPPPPPVLALSCPPAVTLENAATVPAPVMYPAPLTQGGQAPVSVTCTHPSGSDFNLGTTDVVCNAADSAVPQQRVSCVFGVTVRQSFQVGATKFLAFGDSLTAGSVEYNLAGSRLLAIDLALAYPTVLRRLLESRYSNQSIVVENAGVQGEPAVCGPGGTFCGEHRIRSAVEASQPHALLLLHGVNDLGQGAANIDPITEALKFMVRDALRRGVSHVFLSTLLPQKPGVDPDRSWALEHIEPMNDRIRDLAAREGVYLVDAWAAFVGREATLIGKDGLHPTPEGYEVLAGAFFEAIQARLETVVTTPAGPQRMLQVSVAPDAPGAAAFGPQAPAFRPRRR